jgi:diguanylate cyclase (GGDEF)-like protein
MSVAKEWDLETTATELESLDAKIKETGERNQPCLTVLTGGVAGQQFKITNAEAVIGRGSTAAIRIEDDGISRNHATIRCESGRAWIDDLSSRNGTFVNGRRISQRTELRDGDKLGVGRATVLRFGFQDALDESFHQSLVSSALRDGLTKLFNKRYLMERLDSELKFAIRHDVHISLLMLDFDHFKRINDTHGHLAGDAVLVKLSSVVARGVRNEDVVARFGGEELAIILRAIGIEGATQMAERLRKLVEQTVVSFGPQRLRCTVSIGIASYPASGTPTPDSLVEAADLALYRAKHAGRNKISQ